MAFFPFPILPWNSPCTHLSVCSLQPRCFCVTYRHSPSQASLTKHTTFNIFLAKKASKQIGWKYFSHDFPHQKHTQMEMMTFWKFQSLGFRISQVEQYILLPFSQRKIETKFVIFLKLKHFWFSSQSELFCTASAPWWSVWLWSYISSLEQQAGCLWHIFFVLGRASCLGYCF